METGLKTGKVIVHVGLPKTATTSLQVDFFPELESKNVCYLGVRHPRNGTSQNSLFECFVESLITGDVEIIRAELFRLLSEGKVIILSEEMITVSLNNLSWRTKLKNLSRILDGMNYSLLLTVREPVSAMFSYYVEILSHKQKIGKRFIDVAKHDERMEIFHYGKLADELISDFDKERVLVIKFEDLINGKLEGLAKNIAGVNNSFSSSKISKLNDKKKSKDYVYTGERTTVADILDAFMTITKLKDISLLKKYKGIYRSIYERIDNFVITTGSVQKPSTEHFDELKKFLANENEKFSQVFGVRYE